MLAEWDYIAAVKRALRIPVLGNGNIRTLADCEALMAATGVDGVMSAESLLVDPALFSPRRAAPGGAYGHLDGCHLLLEYCDLLDLHPAPWRMVKGHAFQLLGEGQLGGRGGATLTCRLSCQPRRPLMHLPPTPSLVLPPGAWLTEFTDIREQLNRSFDWGTDQLREMTLEVLGRIEATGRTYPVPALSARALARMEAEAALQRAIEEQAREEGALQQLGGDPAAAAAAEGGAAAEGAASEAPAAQQQHAAAAGV